MCLFECSSVLRSDYCPYTVVGLDKSARKYHSTGGDYQILAIFAGAAAELSIEYIHCQSVFSNLDSAQLILNAMSGQLAYRWRIDSKVSQTFYGPLFGPSLLFSLYVWRWMLCVVEWWWGILSLCVDTFFSVDAFWLLMYTCHKIFCIREFTYDLLSKMLEWRYEYFFLLSLYVV